jgi:hypothetical protein
VDNTVREGALTSRYGPPLWRPFALLAAALVVGAGTLIVTVLWAPAAVLLASAVRDALSRPALVLTPEGFRYVVGLHRAFAPWDLVETVRVRQERHFLAFGRNLEIDLSDDTLVVLSKLQLGASPDDVAEVLETAWRSAG